MGESALSQHVKNKIIEHEDSKMLEEINLERIDIEREFLMKNNLLSSYMTN